MVSFQQRLAVGLVRRGIEVCTDLADTPYQALLVIGGTRQLAGLWRARRRGVRLVQRLDGMNWLHRLRLPGGGRRTSLRHFLRAEYGNRLLAFIRDRLAHKIVYQSEFSRWWWEREHGAAPVAHTIVYNGVDLGQFTPQGVESPPPDCFRILLVEGSLMGGYESGLEAAAELAASLGRAGFHDPPRQVELVVVGRVAEQVRRTWEQRLTNTDSVSVAWTGVVPGEQIPAIDRSAHLLYSSDLNAACPNSVIEALACGLPVVAFDTGALSELVQGDAGRIAPYGGDPWKLDPPDLAALVAAARETLNDQPRFRRAARQRAEAAFGLDRMVDGYIQAMLGDVE